MANELTEKDLALLREYKAAINEWSVREPAKLTAAEWDEAWATIQATGEIPEKYKKRIGVQDTTIHSDIEGGRRVSYPEGKTVPGYYDIVWEAWGAEGAAITSRYRSVIAKALMVSIGRQEDHRDAAEPIGERVDDIIDRLLLDPPQASSMLLQKYLPMLNGSPSNDLMQVTKRDFVSDGFTKKATITTRDGHKITVEHFDKLQGVLGTSAKKILDTALLYLASGNFYRGNRETVNPFVEIPLKEYGEANGYQLTPRTMDTPEEQEAENKRVRERTRELKKNLRRDLHDISDMVWSWEETRGRNKGDYKAIRLISNHGVEGGYIQVEFSATAAAYFVSSYIMQYPTALLRHDNRKPNPYIIGRKLAFHNGNDQNRAAGTANTLSVKSLLQATPDIPEYDTIVSRGQRNWRDKIKKPLEDALDENVAIGLISKWEYRDPSSMATYTAETSKSLRWNQYSRLMVDFIMVDAPEQIERRTARAEAKAEAASKSGKPRSKRGRPKKEKKEGGK